MPLSVMRKVPFCAGHRLLNYAGKCAHMHGHNYLAEFYITGSGTDELGLLVDFGDIKSRLKGWIDKHWDHGFILNEEDDQAIAACEAVEPSRYFLLPENPTAETMARYLLEEVCPRELEPLGVAAWKVTLWETENAKAEAIAPDVIRRFGLFTGGTVFDSSM